jgi:hypothetical protein
MYFVIGFVFFQHPAGHLLNDAVQAHHEKHGCGVKSLVVLAAFWMEALESVIEQVNCFSLLVLSVEMFLPGCSSA